MHAGQQVLEWARQNGYPIVQMADELGYSHRTLSQALNLNQITPQLASALFERYGFRVASTVASPDEGEGNPEATANQAPPHAEPSADAEVSGTAEAPSDAYRQKVDPLNAYRQEIRRILDKSRCRGM